MSVDLSLGAVTNMSQTIDNTGGSGVTLPSATTSDAGLMSAADKVKADKAILQGGNAFGTSMTIGTTDNEVVNIMVNGVAKAVHRTANIGITVPLINDVSINNAQINLSTTGTVISRNVADGNPALDVNLANTSSTGAIQRWQLGGSLRAFVNNAGSGTFGRLFAGPGLTQPNYLLDVNAGTVAGANILASFSQNAGSIKLENGTGAASNFAPTIRGVAKGAFPWGILIQGQGATSYGRAGIVLRAVNVDSDGPVTAGNIFQLENNTTPQLTVDYQGVVTIPNLSGTGTRMVTADSTGALSAATEVTSGTYTPTILASTGGTFTANEFTYTKINDIVTVNGRIDCNLTATGQNGIIIDLPYPITVTSIDEIRGTVSGSNVSGATTTNEGAYVTAYFGLNGAAINFFAVDTIAGVFATFSYKV
ncbi:hypothetical protein F0919_07090 [Taibaiella lutea]|uniref:Uncharacterized protein n=1 Tax=Taibaiella lutea TaxID=2608001 RepID=A0A5M6CR39_9BACT|nr:hypothetical protein [Taibaiella lutea]KAA5537433.1 hypothetical protein F0919_07090 [Taibaiella lutea]